MSDINNLEDEKKALPTAIKAKEHEIAHGKLDPSAEKKAQWEVDSMKRRLAVLPDAIKQLLEQAAEVARKPKSSRL
jgi:hypothetical protein